MRAFEPYRLPLCLLLLAIALAGCRAADPIYPHAAVAADHPAASRAGVEILRAGGNAVDAAVATSFCLSVVRPYSCGIGGGGFMVIVPDQSAAGAEAPVALNYRETCPAGVGPDYYIAIDQADASRYGVHAVGVPGSVAGLLDALERYGTLDRATVLAPAIRAAESGFMVDANFVDAMEDLRARRADHPELRAASEWIWSELCRGGTLREGQTIDNPDQARALRLIAAEGADGFYRGPVAEAIVRAVAADGGALTHEDLQGYRPRRGAPLVGGFDGRTVYAMPPPSSGGIATLQVLGLLERVRPRAGVLTADDPTYRHLLAECFKHAFADRAEFLADDAYVSVPVDRLVSDAYLDELAARIDLQRTGEPFEYGSVVPAPIDGGTSHLSVIDADGMAVACTETINLVFGSLVAVPEYGFVLNDEMDDFTTVPGAPNAFGLRQSDRNLPAPGKRPLSSMSPTVITRDGRVEYVAGASGGPRIITGTLQALLHGLLFDEAPVDAVAAPRVHHQWMPDVLYFEPAWPETALEAMHPFGHETKRRPTVGKVQLLRRYEAGIRAASDPRKGGVPDGY